MMWRAFRSVVVVTAAWAVATYLEDLARWLRIRDMSNPERFRPPERATDA